MLSEVLPCGQTKQTGHLTPGKSTIQPPCTNTSTLYNLSSASCIKINNIIGHPKGVPLCFQASYVANCLRAYLLVSKLQVTTYIHQTRHAVSKRRLLVVVALLCNRKKILFKAPPCTDYCFKDTVKYQALLNVYKQSF